MTLVDGRVVLSDEQVAELTSSAFIYIDGDEVEFTYAPLVRDIPPDAVVQALAVEVQQARLRRCDGCAHGVPEPAEFVTVPWEAMKCLVLSGGDGACLRVAVDWFCADFSPQPPL